jgi:hypothetical protein
MFKYLILVFHGTSPIVVLDWDSQASQDQPGLLLPTSPDGGVARARLPYYSILQLLGQFITGLFGFAAKDTLVTVIHVLKEIF